MGWYQREIELGPMTRGFHIITEEIQRQVPEIGRCDIGLAHIFIKHTSASLAVNECADPSVRRDLEAHFNHLAPENARHFTHVFEGPDDMPAHITAVILGSAVSVPISKGRLNMGVWQGVYLCEHRDRGGRRHLVVTVMGQEIDT